MSEERRYRTIVTDIGKAKVMQATLTGSKVNIVAAVVGDGGGAFVEPRADMTALVREVWRGPIAGMEINPKSANMLDVKIVVPGSTGGFTVRECGIEDDEGDLIAVCNLPDTEKAAIEDGVAAALTVLMHIVLTDGDMLEFSVDPTIDTASASQERFTIPVDLWHSRTEEQDGGEPAGGNAGEDGAYSYRADVAIPTVTALHIPVATLDIGCLDAANNCEMCPTVESMSGGLRFRAKRIPDRELNGTVLLIAQGGGSGGGGGGQYILPTATAFRLGGVKIGEGVDVQADGTISLNGNTVIEEVAAQGDDVTEMLDKVFGASEQESI